MFRTVVPNCPGVPLIWDPHNPTAVFTGYPWGRHVLEDQPLGYEIGRAHYENGKFKYFDIHASNCSGAADIFGSACPACSKLMEHRGKVEDLKKLSEAPPG